MFAPMRERACWTMIVVPEEEVADVTSTKNPTIGLGEQQLREAFEKELLHAMKTEGNAPTVHAIAHSLARIIELDHLRMAEQLRAAGVRLEHPETRPQPYALD